MPNTWNSTWPVALGDVCTMVPALVAEPSPQLIVAVKSAGLPNTGGGTGSVKLNVPTSTLLSGTPSTPLGMNAPVLVRASSAWMTLTCWIVAYNRPESAWRRGYSPGST